MNTVNTVATPSYVPTVQTTGQVEGVSTQATTKVETPVLSPPAASPTAPILLPPGRSDYAGASAIMSSYTALIVLMCEVNRESYAANRAMADMQMATRVTELHEAADKRRTAAIVGLVMGVISGAAGIAGGAAGIARSAKGVNKLLGLQNDQKRLDNSMKPPKGPHDEQKGLDKGHLEKTKSAEQFDVPDEFKIANKIGDDSFPKNINDFPANNKTVKSQKEIDVEMSIVDANSSGTQSMTVLFRALQDVMGSMGQSASGIVSAEADDMTAEAERTEGARQVTVSNMNQFQDLMSKFTQILSSLLEAENKARSAAAQA